MNDLARELSRFGRRQDDVVEALDVRKVLESALEVALPELRLCDVHNALRAHADGDARARSASSRSSSTCS